MFGDFKAAANSLPSGTLGKGGKEGGREGGMRGREEGERGWREGGGREGGGRERMEGGEW